MRIGRRRLRRGELLVAAAVLVMIAAAVVIWDLGGAAPGRSAPLSQSGTAAGDSGPDLDSPSPVEQPADDEVAGAEQQTDDEDSDLGSASESGSGGGQPSNRPPVIDSPGLASDGLVLTIEPEVTDPDGDDVTLLYDVDGMRIDPAQDCMAPGCDVPLRLADVGYQSEIAVTINATDSHGASTSETHSHTIQARTDALLGEVRYAIDDPSACFSAVESRDLSFRLSLTGAIEHEQEHETTISASNVSGRLFPGTLTTFVGEEPPPLGVQLSVTLSDVGTVANAAPRQYTSSTEEVLTHWRNNPCEYTLTYLVEYVTR